MVVCKVVLNCTLLHHRQVKTVVPLVEFVAELKLGAAGPPDPVLVIRKWMHSANLLELFAKLVLAELAHLI